MKSINVIRIWNRFSDQFLGWIFAIGPKVKIVGPAEVVKKFRDELKERYENYK